MKEQMNWFVRKVTGGLEVGVVVSYLDGLYPPMAIKAIVNDYIANKLADAYIEEHGAAVLTLIKTTDEFAESVAEHVALKLKERFR